MSNGSFKSVQDIIDQKGDELVEYFYNETLSPHGIGRGGLSPVPPEWTNWREEQRAWRESVVLMDQSHHMPEMLSVGV